MKRAFLGFAWFVGIYFFAITLGSGIAGGIAGGKASQNARSVSESTQLGAQAGRIAGERFARENRTIIFLMSAVLATVGTVFGVLPGTKPKEKL